MVWVIMLMWVNYISLFEVVGLIVKEYFYYDYENKDLLFDDMINILK